MQTPIVHPGLQVTVLSDDASAYARHLKTLQPEYLQVIQVAAHPSEIDCERVSVLLADPDLAAQIIPRCPNLIWCQSTWAGNAPLLKLTRRDYRLTGVKGVFTRQMREYLFAYLLHFSRNVDGFRQAQAEAQGKWSLPGYTSLQNKTLGIMGAGSIGQSLIETANLFGLRCVALVNSPRAIEGFNQVFGAAEKEHFAAQCDFVFNLLPDTPSTRHIIDQAFLRHLPAHGVLINAGRGSAIDDDALLEALNNNQLAGAVLDVFSTEPLPDDHPFWAHDKVWITQHTAAESEPADIARLFVDNAQRLRQGQPLKYQFDFDKGY